MSHTRVHKTGYHFGHSCLERDTRRKLQEMRQRDREEADQPRGITDSRPGDLQNARTAQAGRHQG